MEVTLLLAMCFCNLACFIAGAKVGQAVTKGEKIETPSVNPMEAVRKHQAKKEAQMEQDKVDIIMRNIEGYDGTGRGQEDVPGR